MLQSKPRKTPQRFFAAFAAAFTRICDRRTCAVWLGSALAAAYTGPFGTYGNFPTIEMFLTWVVLLGGGIIIAYVVNELCNEFLTSLSTVFRMAIFVLVCSIAIGALADVIISNVFVPNGSDTRPSLLELWTKVCGAFLLLIMIRQALGIDAVALESSNTTSQEQAALPVHSRLARRLNIPNGARIIHISANGHFVDVQTCAGNFRTRMRFSDAVDELDGTYGLTVHRSHWVHIDAVSGWVPTAKKPYVKLENDAQIPISKPHLQKVMRAGLPQLVPSEHELEETA